MGIQDLINTQFMDATNHVTVNGDDMLGVIFNHYWGPVNTLQELGSTEFFGKYPESLPLGASTIDVQKYFSFAQVKQAFNCGMPRVQSYRPKCGWLYQQVNVTDSAVADPVTASDQFSSVATNILSIATKYPGFFPQSLAQGYSRIKMRVAVAADFTISVEIFASKDSTASITTTGNNPDVLLESFKGSCVAGSTQDGMPFYLPDVLENSRFISCQVNGVFESTLASDVIVFMNYNDSYDSSTTQGEQQDIFNSESEGGGVGEVTNIINTIFADIEQNNSTMLINPYADQKAAITSAMINAGEAAKTFNPIIGVSTSDAFTKSSLTTARGATVNSKFGLYVAGREVLTLFGMRLISNCVGGFAGRVAAIAKEVRMNQMPSAKMYGTYPGTLLKTLTFDEVLSLHDSLGVISVYSSKNGPSIFGVRSMNANQDSYFGKANVARVTANVLKNIFPIVLQGIHTDVASEQTSMVGMQTRLNNVLATFIANRNLKDKTRAICDDSVNNDITTQGGKYLNIILEMWYIGLAERINILVKATDSSVTAEIQ